LSTIYYEATPNPQSMKFLLGQQLANETVFIEDSLHADRSPLAHKLFGFPWMSAVLIGPDFVTITKQDWVSWEVLAEPLSDLIREHLENGEALLADRPTAAVTSNDDDPNDSALVRDIKRVLNTEIRPAVAMDGGDILFDRFENGVVFLKLHGSCAGCPSSVMTLKQGIEERLKEYFPDQVQSVEQAAIG
jgi:Fe-S cluster biogenesis protein NfuA